MKRVSFLIVYLFVIVCSNSFAQSSPKIANYFGEQIVVDSSSIILLPVLYNPSLFSSSKMEVFGNYYANIMFYNFKTDSYNELFPSNTYIKSFSDSRFYGDKLLVKNITKRHILYLVANVDHNKNNKIDSSDPFILYISDKQGDNLKALTTENENVESFSIYENESFALIKIQRDYNKDRDFDYKDKDFYYVKLDLSTLKFGNKIEIK